MFLGRRAKEALRLQELFEKKLGLKPEKAADVVRILNELDAPKITS